MPIVPNLLERLVFFNLNRGPGPVLDIFGAVGFRAVLAAVNLGLFDALHNGPQTPAELARQLGADERGITVLLDTLGTLGYTTQKADRYANTAMTAKWLVRPSPMNIAAGYSYWGAILAQLWNNLEESIRTGQPPVNLYEWIEQQPDVSRDFQTWMIAIARLTSDEIVRKIKLPPDARRLLDVGGGHGMYSIALCQRHPALTATVFDSPQVLRVARTSIAAAHLDERIAVQPGNFWQDDLGSGYDIAFVFNIVHGFTPEQNTALLGNVARALHPGGTVVIQEQLAGRAPGPTAKAASQLLGLSYFHLLGGQIYRFADVARWLADAGFNAPRRINLLKSPGLSLIVATKAG